MIAAAAAPLPAGAPKAGRAELFRVLGDEDRLRLLALCAEEELAVGELAALLHDSQPQVSKKTAPLRQAGLLQARREGARTLLRVDDEAAADPVVAAALVEGRRLAAKDGALARIAAIVAAREEHARRFFDVDAPQAPPPDAAAASTRYLEALAPLLPARKLAVDLGTGDGAFLPVLSPLYGRVLAVDRSAARLARCAARAQVEGLANVRLFEGSFDDAALFEEVARQGFADLVLCARLLHHAAKPQDAVVAMARLVRPGGHLVVVDYLPHDDESMREAQADVWLGFPADRLRAWLSAAGFDVLASVPWSGPPPAGEPDAHLPWQIAVGRKPVA